MSVIGNSSMDLTTLRSHSHRRDHIRASFARASMLSLSITVLQKDHNRSSPWRKPTGFPGSPQRSISLLRTFRKDAGDHSRLIKRSRSSSPSSSSPSQPRPG
ncbi:hypothetical protein M3J09_005401 [Ascochyta lentis]